MHTGFDKIPMASHASMKRKYFMCELPHQVELRDLQMASLTRLKCPYGYIYMHE